MGSNTLMGICFALTGLGAWNTWTLYQVNSRLDRIERQRSLSTSPKPLERAKALRKPNLDSDQRVADSVKGKKKTFPVLQTIQDEDLKPSQTSIDLTDPELQEAIAQIAETNAKKKEDQRRKSKMEAYKVSLRHELEQFSEEKEYDTNTVKSIELILNESTSEWTAVREQVREGEISWMDARTEFKAIGDETEGKITEFISPEDYQELRARLWGDWGR